MMCMLCISYDDDMKEVLKEGSTNYPIRYSIKGNSLQRIFVMELTQLTIVRNVNDPPISSTIQLFLVVW